MTPDEYRQELFEDSVPRLAEMADRAVSVLRLSPSEVAMVVIDVDDASWTPLAEKLMPGHDWQQYRDREEVPVARGSVMWSTVEVICTICPGVSVALDAPPPDGHLYAFVLGGGGASLFAVPYSGAQA